MTVVQPAAPPPADSVRVAGVEEPSRFTAYTTGCAARPSDLVDRILRPVEGLLVPELSRLSRRRVTRPRSSS